MEQQNRVVPGTGWVSSWVVACMVLGIFLSLTAIASASRTLRASERSDIVRSTHVTASNGRRISDSVCIAGHLSTVDRRWAAYYYSNTRSCVRRYGGASGEATLIKRPGPSSRNWSRKANIGDNCRHHAGGAPDSVLRDLGCGFL